MGWWDSADGQSVIGDGPVDYVMDAYRRLQEHWRETAQPERPPDALFEIEADAPWTKPELAIVREALQRVRAEYEDSEMSREPTAREIRETIDFAVGQLKRM
jgi:hypothetical protein